MTRRAVKTVQDFEYRSDFGPQELDLVTEPEPTEEAPSALKEGQITLTGPELAMMLSEARAEGLVEGREQASQDDDDRVQLVTNKLNEALANLVALAGHLEASAYDSAMSETSLRLINATAKRIVDGQGDLFSAGQKTETDTVDPTGDDA